MCLVLNAINTAQTKLNQNKHLFIVQQNFTCSCLSIAYMKLCVCRFTFPNVDILFYEKCATKMNSFFFWPNRNISGWIHKDGIHLCDRRCIGCSYVSKSQHQKYFADRQARLSCKCHRTLVDQRSERKLHSLFADGQWTSCQYCSSIWARSKV